jgi:anhydro-N-acetylmuramic acid kinase
VIVVSVASGTSADGLDVAVVDLVWDGSTIQAALRHHATEPWPGGLRERLLALLPPASTTAADVCELDTRIGQAVGAAAARVVDRFPETELVVSPGQTVHHEVRHDRCLGTLQLGQPAWIAEATGLPVLSDLRARDVAAGGHGAPLASTFDALWLAGPKGPRAALNLGGIANATVVGAPIDRAALAWDTGPANCLLDVASARATGGRLRFDEDGRLAASGSVRTDLREVLLAHPFFRLKPPKSTGRETFSAAYLDEVLSRFGDLRSGDLLATLTDLTATTVAQALAPYDVVEVVVSGGGARNPALMAALRQRLSPTPLLTSAELGLPVQAKEAVMWALLGFLTWHAVPGTNGATGGRPRVLGRITPGSEPLVLPQPAGIVPTRLILG